jgi:RNA polymerase sigma-70 factor, ECF subfamily
MSLLDECQTARISEAACLPLAGLAHSPAEDLKTKADTTSGALDIGALTRAVRHGDANAFSRFYDLYSFRLYKFLLVLAHGDEDQARELCQAVLVKLARRLPLFSDERRLWLWLSKVAKNAFIDQYRARQRRGQLMPLDQLPAGLEAETAATHRFSEGLREALACLPAEERELIEAAYVDGRPLQELAEASGQSYKALECRLARLRQKLKQHVLRSLLDEQKP